MKSIKAALQEAGKNNGLNIIIAAVINELENPEMEKAVNALIETLVSGKDIMEITFLNVGCTSAVFEIVSNMKSYVLKLGKERRHFNLPEHKHILKPLLRKQIKDKNGEIRLIIEMQDKVRTYKSDDYHKEGYIEGKEIWKAWNEMLEDGIVSCDMDYENFGRDESGEIVVLDTDNIFTQEELGDKWDDTCHMAKFQAERPENVHYYTKADKAGRAQGIDR